MIIERGTGKRLHPVAQNLDQRAARQFGGKGFFEPSRNAESSDRRCDLHLHRRCDEWPVGSDAIAATAAFEDDGNDGVYLVAHPGATPVEVIAGLHTPLGLAWQGDVLFVASAGRVDAYSNLAATTFANHRAILTFPDVPAVAIDLIDRPNERPWGAGEPTAAVVPSAIANAIYDATGVRLRSVPFTPDKVLAALKTT